LPNVRHHKEKIVLVISAMRHFGKSIWSDPARPFDILSHHYRILRCFMKAYLPTLNSEKT
jgi:deoxyribodipyrimidine photolyase-like uncharacterized protein